MTPTEDPAASEAPFRTTAQALAQQEPELAASLARLGTGAFVGEVRSYRGRNPNWCGVTESGRWVFAKRLEGRPEEARERSRRARSFERLVAARSPEHLRWPECLLLDEDSAVQVFAFLRGARSGRQLASEEQFDEGLAAMSGRALAELHELGPAVADELDATPLALPPITWLRALPLSRFLAASRAELDAWRLMQRDEALVAALSDLRAWEEDAARVPIHGDLRLDQLLVDASGTLHLSDWEEFRSGDAARDVGSFAGEWLHRAMQALPSAQAPDDDAESAHRAVVAAGTQALERLRPLVGAFWRSYRAQRGTIDGGFTDRAAGFAGWHLLDRMIAATKERSRLSASQRATAGVGRTALLRPADFAGLIGLEGQ